MANEQNLIKNRSLSTEEAKRLGSLGGKASVKARRKKKLIKEQLNMLLSLPMKDGKNKDMLKNLGFKEKDINNQLAMTFSLYTSALSGNVKAFKLIQDTIGETPIIEKTADEGLDKVEELLTKLKEEAYNDTE